MSASPPNRPQFTDWLEQARDEYQKQRYTFIASVITIVLFVYDLFFSKSLTELPGSSGIYGDALFMGQIIAVILSQGASASIFTATQSQVCRIMSRFGIILLAVNYVMLSWVLSFNSWWFCKVSNSDIDAFVATIAISWVFTIGFIIQSFVHDTASFPPDYSGDSEVFWLVRYFVCGICILAFGIIMGIRFANHLAP